MIIVRSLSFGYHRHLFPKYHHGIRGRPPSSHDVFCHYRHTSSSCRLSTRNDDIPSPSPSKLNKITPSTKKHESLARRYASSYQQTAIVDNEATIHENDDDDDDNDEENETCVARPSSLDNNTPFFRIFYNDVYEVILPPNHRFPMEKYRSVRQTVQATIADLSLEQRRRVRYDLVVSPLATVDELTTTHCPTYVSDFMCGNQTPQESRNVGFPWSPEGVDRALSSVGGTVAAACSVCDELRLQLQRRTTDGDDSSPPAPLAWAAHVAGGTHHAFHSRGEGFCVFSDIAVATNVILRRYPDVVRRGVLIVDLDVHQGNGNARLFEGREEVVTFSMHCRGNYFSRKEEGDVDVELPVGCGDGMYLSTLKYWLDVFERESDRYDFIFYQAGVDVLDEDRLGRMSLSRRGVSRRDRMVFDMARRTGKGMVITMGGGYPKGEWDPIIEAHAGVYLGAYDYLANL